MVASDKFQKWIKIKSSLTAQIIEEVEKKVEEWMEDKNLKIEYGVQCQK